MTVTGPDFLALQVRDLDGSATFYESLLGLTRLPDSPPGAVVFATRPIPFAVRDPLPGVDLDAAAPRPGLGVALWLHADDAQDLHDRLAGAGVPITAAPLRRPVRADLHVHRPRRLCRHDPRRAVSAQKARLTLQARGPFSLAASARFVEGFPGGQGGGGAGRLDLAFPVEREWQTVGVRVTDDQAGLGAAVVVNPGRVDLAVIRTQVERILSLDVDGTGFTSIGERDAVVQRLQHRYPGLRPVQFHTPYEAAAWAIIGHRIRMPQAAAIKTRLAEQLGEPVDFGDATLPAFPAPDRLAGLAPTEGLPERKVDQLRALGRAAAEGHLDAARLQAQPRAEALAHLQELPGIGPFSAELVLLRGAGDPDAFPTHEKRLHRAMAAVYHLGEDPDLDALQRVSDGWRPYRTWVALLLRVWLEEETREIATGRRGGTVPDEIGR